MNTKKILLAALVATFAFGLAACDKPGTAEKIGQDIDNAVEKAGDKVENAADKAGEKLGEAGDKVKEETENK